MRINSIKGFFIGALLTGGAALMSSCDDNVKHSADGLHKYMAERGDTQNELDSIINITNRGFMDRTSAARQSVLDSMAYRDLFNQTLLANDSSAVEEFNKIASICKLEQLSNPMFLDECQELFIKKLTENGEEIQIVDRLKSTFPGGTIRPRFKIQRWQHFIDKHFYRKYFNKHGLFNDSTDFQDKFSKLSDSIKPQ